MSVAKRWWQVGVSVFLTSVILAGVWLSVRPASPVRAGVAATLTVTSTADNGANSLRQAIATANSGDTIQFNLTYPAVITLTSGPLIINKNLTLNGPGAANLAVDGNQANRVFELTGGVVAITNLTIQNGASTGDGGGIYTLGDLTLTNVNILSNTAAINGGGSRLRRDHHQRRAVPA